MHTSHWPTLLLSLASYTLSASAKNTTFTLPSPTLPNGAANPFYPCPAINISSCPYRCYTLSSTNITASTPPTLDASCYSAAEASVLIATHTHICVKCLAPLAKEIPASASSPAECVPLATYFNATTPQSTTPSRCGFQGHRIATCAWNCAEAQVPFSSCSAKNATGEYEVCEKCIPQCSTPRIVFDPPSLPRNFSLSAGGCGNDGGGGGGGVGERTACPWRCTDAGNQGNGYCSLVDRGVERGFTTCVQCT